MLISLCESREQRNLEKKYETIIILKSSKRHIYKLLLLPGMKKHAFSGIILILVFSLTLLPVSGDEPTVSVSGNVSTITPDTNGTYQILISQVNPGAPGYEGNSTTSILLKDELPKEPCPAAILLTNSTGNQTTLMVQASELIYSAQNQTLSFNISALKFYDGTILSQYNENKSVIEPGEYGNTSIYLEVRQTEVDNACLYCSGPNQVCTLLKNGCCIKCQVI